ncbi:MAG: type II toxin-antitoxin system RelE/ParE family toxin [Patescibacteria group bacterium]
MFKIIYHPDVFEKDFSKISKLDCARIIRLIEKKLMIDPIQYGKPLQGELKGLYRLRADPYRIIYSVKRERITVFVLNVGLRRNDEVYNEAVKRS